MKAVQPNLKAAVVVIWMCITGTVSAQNFSAGVNTESPNPRAVLHLVSPNGDQGLLIPQLTTAQRTSMAGGLSAQANGLLVYDAEQGLFYFWLNSGWIALSVSDSQTLALNGTTLSIANGNGIDLAALGFLTAEVDPTVPANIKDGISWTEIADIPAGFADGVDNEGVSSVKVDGTTVLGDGNTTILSVGAINATQVNGLSTVATTGSFSDLRNLPPNLDLDATDDLTAVATNPTLTGNGTAGTPLGVNVGTGASQIVQIDAAGKLPAIDGSQLTNVTAAPAAGSITNTELAAGAVQSANILDGQVVDADVNASAAIAGTKVNPNFGTQNISTTGTMTASSYSGDGSGLTGVVSTVNVGTTMVGNGSVGTPLGVNVGTGASQIVQLDAAGLLPAINGSALTNVTSANFSGSLLGDVTGFQGATVVSSVNPSAITAGGATAGQVLEFDGVSSWVPVSQSFNTHNSFTAPLAGDVLTWDVLNGRWDALAPNALTFPYSSTQSIGSSLFTLQNDVAPAATFINSNNNIAVEIQGNLTFLDQFSRTISILNNTTGDGDNLDISAGGTTFGGASGGVLNLRSGNGAGLGNGGNIRLEPGTGGINGGIDMRGVTRFGQNGALPGRIELEDAGGANAVSISADGSSAAYNLTLPAVNGAGALTNDGAGILSWSAGGGDFSVDGGNNHLGGPTAGSALSTGLNNVIIGGISGGGITTASANVVIGQSANTDNTNNNVSIGPSATSGASNSVAVGFNANASGAQSVAIGDGTIVTVAGGQGVAIGHFSQTLASRGIALGDGATVPALADSAIAIGYLSLSQGASSIAIGGTAVASANGGLAIGGSSTGGDVNAIAIGDGALAALGATNGIVLGASSFTNSANGIAIGFTSQATAADAIAIGREVTAGIANTVVIGDGTAPTPLYNVGINTGTPRGALDVAGSQYVSVRAVSGVGISDNIVPTDYMMFIQSGTSGNIILPVASPSFIGRTLIFTTASINNVSINANGTGNILLPLGNTAGSVILSATGGTNFYTITLVQVGLDLWAVTSGIRNN